MNKRDHTVFVLIDVQEKLLPHMQDSRQLLITLEKLLKGLKILGVPIIWNEQYPKGLGPTETSLANILEEASPLIKNTFSCCGNRDFLQVLEETGAKRVILAGIEAHVCVYQTARDLLKRGYQVEIVNDAVSSRSRENKETALQRLRDLHADITSMEMVLFDLLERAEGDTFKAVSRIVK